jgi:hypothetical protein
LFIYKQGTVIIYTLVYVDDIIVISSTVKATDLLLAQLRQSFPVKDLGKLGFFLGIEVKHQSDGLHLSQQKYITDLLEITNMMQAKTVSTPMATVDKLSRHIGTPLAAEDVTRYRSVVGALQYLTLIRTDISFSVNKVSISPSPNRCTLVSCQACATISQAYNLFWSEIIFNLAEWIC